MLRSSAQREHSTRLSQLGHACHLVERLGDSGRGPRPCALGPEAGLGTFPTLVHPKPGSSPPVQQMSTGAAAAAGPKSSHRMLALTPRRAPHQAQMKLLLLHPTPSYAHLDSRKAHCWLSFGG